MNATQMKYLKERIDSVVSAKIKAYDVKFPELPELSWEEQKAQIRTGKAKLLSDARSHTDLRYAFEFIDPLAAKRKARDVARAKAVESITKAAQKLADQLMLKDVSDDILGAIEAFEKS